MSTQGPPPPSDPYSRPRLRGWLHVYAFGGAIVGGVVMCTVAAALDGWKPLVGCAVYAVTVCGLFGVSALYHRRVWGPRGYATMKRLDHSMIFLFIAGTYTPFCLLLLPEQTARLLLIVVWGGALAGVALQTAWPRAPRWLAVPLYVSLGWAAIAVMPDILHRGGVATVVLLIVGGTIYSLGAICYALKWPTPGREPSLITRSSTRPRSWPRSATTWPSTSRSSPESSARGLSDSSPGRGGISPPGLGRRSPPPSRALRSAGSPDAPRRYVPRRPRSVPS